MKRIIGWALAGWACAGLVASPVLAASQETVTFCGPVVALTEAGCIGVTTGTAKFELGEAKPKPEVGTTIAGTGTPSNAMTTCQEGTHLTNIAWKAVPSCPAAVHRPTGY
ncbi:MAG: hypothetical protein ISS15_12090 [Alphaproteobacteria bacterium]|nr:hypothetical protein [Alphaproteobacteria bacterium]MBL6936557.1 hypothetical protein [Alphaproteobacteria bacterium]MBL7098392.1 hypothetical protein [Alphaproteobacteria bacterium]